MKCISFEIKHLVLRFHVKTSKGTTRSRLALPVHCRLQNVSERLIRYATSNIIAHYFVILHGLIFYNFIENIKCMKHKRKKTK